MSNTSMPFVELIARALCQAEAIDPDGTILPNLPHWRKFEFSAAIVATAILQANKDRQVPPPIQPAA